MKMLTVIWAVAFAAFMFTGCKQEKKASAKAKKTAEAGSKPIKRVGKAFKRGERYIVKLSPEKDMSYWGRLRCLQVSTARGVKLNVKVTGKNVTHSCVLLFAHGYVRGKREYAEMVVALLVEDLLPALFVIGNLYGKEQVVNRLPIEVLMQIPMENEMKRKQEFKKFLWNAMNRQIAGQNHLTTYHIPLSSHF